MQLSRSAPCQGDILLVLDADPCSMEQTRGRAHLQPPQCPQPWEPLGTSTGPGPVGTQPQPSEEGKATP